MDTSNSIRLIAFDLDGTVLNSQKEVTPRTQAALRRAREAGVYVIPATGRQFHDIPREVMEPAHPFVIANNGAQIYRLPEGGLVFSRTFDRAAALALLYRCRTFNGMIFGAYDATGVFDNRGRGFESGITERMIHSGKWKKVHPLTDIETLVTAEAKSIIKLVMIFEDPDERRRAFDEFLPRKDLYVTFFDRDNMEIMPAGINKGEALKFIAGELNIGMDQVMSLGDSDNDREMIRYAGYGTAMGNASDEVKAEAKRISGGCDDDGAAAAIEWALENR